MCRFYFLSEFEFIRERRGRGGGRRRRVGVCEGARETFNDWGGGRGCHKFVPVSGGDGTKIAPPGDLFDQPPGKMS